MKKKTSYIIMAIIFALGLTIDLVSKSVLAQLLLSRGDISIIPNFFRLTYVENPGAGLGIFAGKKGLLIAITCVFIVFFVVYDIFCHSTSGWYVVGVSLIIAGGIGNLVDRIAFGFVRDFLSLKLFTFVFNFADLFITVGIVCFAVHLLIGMVKEIKSKKDRGNETNDK